MCAEKLTDKDSTIQPETVVSMYRAQGRTVVETSSCWWYNAYGQKRVYFSFPPHRWVTPERDELDEVLRSNGAFAVRFISPPDPDLNQSFIWTARKPYTIDSLSSNNRSKVRRGLKQCTIRQITFEDLASLGQTAQRDTLARLGKDMKGIVASSHMEQSPAFEAWGAFYENELAAYVIILKVEDWIHIQVNRSANEFLKYYPNNALVFTITDHFLNERGYTAVSYGLEPLTRMESLEQFKLSMGYVKEAVTQHIVFAPRLRILVNPITVRLVELSARLLKNNRRLQQLAGLLRYT